MSFKHGSLRANDITKSWFDLAIRLVGINLNFRLPQIIFVPYPEGNIDPVLLGERFAK